MKGIVIWVTGLPGSGKSALCDEIKRQIPYFHVLRMDALRKIATPKPRYSEEEREILYRSLVFMAKTISELGHNVLIDATGNRRRWRTLARRLIPSYIEVYLKCPIEVCMEREGKRRLRRGAPQAVYKKAKSGWPVPGIKVPYEEPKNPELTLNTVYMTIREEAEAVKNLIRSLTKEKYQS